MSRGRQETALEAIVFGILSLVVVGIGSILLFWLGRSQQPRTELVVDEELLADTDDPGVDVDLYRRN